MKKSKIKRKLSDYALSLLSKVQRNSIISARASQIERSAFGCVQLFKTSHSQCELRPQPGVLFY